MKKRNIIAISIAGIMVTSCLVSATACGETPCTHNVGEWQTVTEATCVAEGEKKGICANCLEEVFEAIPVNADAHAYDEWAVTTPTNTQKGSALKTCSLDETHTLTVTLPELTSSKYTTYVSKRPSALGDGERTYEYEHLVGNVVFTTPIPASGIQTVMDAVEVSSAVESHDLIRNATGTVGYEYHAPEYVYDGGSLPANNQVYSHEYFYEFGENYTHIDGGTYDNTERWYGVDAQGIYGFAYGPSMDYTSDTKHFYYETGRGIEDAEKYIDGFRFALQYETGLGTYYGAENLLAGLYRQAKLSTNEDFTESVSVNSSGKRTYTFSFGHYNREADGLFGNVKVSFRLTEEYTIQTLTVESKVYVNNTDLNITTGGQFNTWKLVTVNGKQVARVIEGQENGAHYVDKITVEQKTKAETAEEPVPENPYQRDKGVIYESYDIVYQNEVLTEESEPIEWRASSATDPAQITFSIKNIAPQSAITLGVDSFRFFYRNEAGEDVPIDEFLNNGGVNVYMNAQRDFTVRCRVTGLVTIVVQSAGMERTVKLNVAPVAPSALYPVVYTYSSSGYTQTKALEGTANATVYVGQPLYFMADAPVEESAYTVKTVQNSVASGNAEACTLISSVSPELLPFRVASGESVSSFTASEAGTYTVQLASTKDSAITCSIVVTVKEAPAIADILSNEYSANLSYPAIGRANVAFSTVGGETRATVSYNGRQTVLKCVYDGESNTLSSEIIEGDGILSDTEYNFSLSMNEAYDLVLTHPMGNDYAGMNESAVLWRDVNTILSGAYTASFAEGSATVLFSTEEEGAVSATVSFNGESVTLACSYDIVTRELTTSVVGEATEQFSLSFDGAFNLLLSRATADGGSEQVVLHR